MNTANYPDTMSALDTAETQPQRPPFRYLLWYRYLPAAVVMLLILLVSYALPSDHQRLAFGLCVLGLYVLVRLGMWTYSRRQRRGAEAVSSG